MSSCVILHSPWIKHTCQSDEGETKRDAPGNSNPAVQQHLNHCTVQKLTPYSSFEFISLVLTTSSGWHRTVAHPPCAEKRKRCPISENVVILHTLTYLQRRVTYCKHTGQEVCEDAVSQATSSQDQLLGLVVTGQLHGQNAQAAK